MLRRFSSLVPALLLTLSLAVPAPAASKKATSTKATATSSKKKVPEAFPAIDESGPPKISAASAIVIDAYTGRTLFEINADAQRAVASTQKLLTAMVLLDSGNLDGTVTIAASDTWVEPTKLGVKAGERYTRRELLRVLLIKSCNDAAAALARDNAGSVSAFAAKMNAKAYQLGATRSNFVNPHGLTEPGQRSTARDMAKIAFAAYRYPFIRNTVDDRAVTFRFNSGRSVTLESTNKLLKTNPAVTGMKTGYTSASGRCLVTSATFGGRSVILVQLGSKTSYIFDDAAKLVRWSPSPGPFARY